MAVADGNDNNALLRVSGEDGVTATATEEGKTLDSHEVTTAVEESANKSSNKEEKKHSGIWSPPHLFHRHSQHHNQHNHQQQHNQSHHHHYHLNPLQYLHHDRRHHNESRKPPPLCIRTGPPSPASGSSPTATCSSSKAASPTIEQNPNQSTHLYHPPYLHFTHQQPVKETHLLDIDFDPISGRKSINRYEIIDEIGRGTHGKVKLGRDLMSNEYVAIKIVERHTRPRLGKVVREEDEKVRREIAILKKCRHPNVVRLIEVIDDPASKKVYLVLEYVELGEIVWRKRGQQDLLRRERRRLKKELTGESEDDQEDSEEERLRRWKRRRRKELLQQTGRPGTGTSSIKSKPGDENPNFWSLELGGLTEESDNYLSVDDDDEGDDDAQHVPASVDAPHIPPLDSDTEEPSHMMSSLSMLALSSNPEVPPYSFSHEDLQYVPALTFEQARTTFRDTLLGLEYLHYHGIIHRDIKPANLLWTKAYRVKISDFGVSYLGRGAGDEDEEDGDPGEKRKKKDQVSGRDEEIELAKTVGTPAFFAPELCFFDASKPRPQITSAIDIWALGVTLYCLIFARCPFLADGEFELFNVIAKQPLFIPQRRLRPAQGYSASLFSQSRPNSSRRSLHQRTHSGASVKTVPRPGSSRGRMISEEQETELIPDELRDLLTRMLTKDPTKRITIKEVKRHPWVLQGIPNPAKWLDDTDPERLNGGSRIEVNEEEMEKAVVPASWSTAVIGRVRSGINKLRQKMGIGGGSDGLGSAKKEKVGLHPLASRGSDTSSVVRGGHHSFLGGNRPGSSSSNSTLQEQSDILNRFSLSNQTATPYNNRGTAIPILVTPQAPVSASSLTRLLSVSGGGRSSTSSNPHTPTKEGRISIAMAAGGGAHPTTHSPMKWFLNSSQSSLANSLSRSLSRSSNNSERNCMSGNESSTTNPSPIKKKKKDKKGRMLPASLLRRTRSTVVGGCGSNANHLERTVRRATSSNLGYEVTSSPSPSSQSTIRRYPSMSSPDKDQPPKMRFAAAQSRTDKGKQLGRSRRSSASSTTTSINQARETVAGALGGLLGKGRRLVRSFSRTRDTFASGTESEPVVSGSGGSGDDEREHRDGELRISILRRKRSAVVEALPVVSRVNARGNMGSVSGGVRSGTSTPAASPMTTGVEESVGSYFDLEVIAAGSGCGRGKQLSPLRTCLSSATRASDSTVVAMRATTETTEATGTSARRGDGNGAATEEREREMRQWTEGLNMLETSCPPSPDDYVMWERQVKARERRERERDMARELQKSLEREVVGRSGGDGVEGQQQQLRHRGSITDGPLVSSSSEEKMYMSQLQMQMRAGTPQIQQMHSNHRHTGTTTSSSLTESNSLPSIQSMLESSAASSVSADGGWTTAVSKKVLGTDGEKGVGTVTGVEKEEKDTGRDSGVYTFQGSTRGSIGAMDEDSNYAYQHDNVSQQHRQQQQQDSTKFATPIAIAARTSSSKYTLLAPPPLPHHPHSDFEVDLHHHTDAEADIDADSDNEALFMGLGTSRGRLGLNRSRTVAVGIAQNNLRNREDGAGGKDKERMGKGHKRAVSTASGRSVRSVRSREGGGGTDREGGRRREGGGATGKGRRRRSSREEGVDKGEKVKEKVEVMVEEGK